MIINQAYFMPIIDLGSSLLLYSSIKGMNKSRLQLNTGRSGRCANLAWLL